MNGQIRIEFRSLWTSHAYLYAILIRQLSHVRFMFHKKRRKVRKMWLTWVDCSIRDIVCGPIFSLHFYGSSWNLFQHWIKKKIQLFVIEHQSNFNFLILLSHIINFVAEWKIVFSLNTNFSLLISLSNRLKIVFDMHWLPNIK